MIFRMPNEKLRKIRDAPRISGRVLSVWLIILLFGLAARGGAAQSDPAALPPDLDVKEARTLALLYNPGLARLKAQLAEQDGVLSEIRAAKNPRLDATGNYTEEDENKLQSFGASSAPDRTRWDANIEAGITVFTGGRNRYAMKSGIAQRRALRGDIAAREQQLVVDVYHAFLDAWLAQDTTHVQREAMGVLEEQLNLAKNRLDAGTGARFDVLQAEVVLANARPPLIRAQNDFRRAMDRLRRFIGLPYPEGVEAEDMKLNGIPDEVDDEISRPLHEAILMATEQRPEIEAVEYEAEAARHEMESTRRANRPQVDLFARYGIENDPFGEMDELHGWTAGVRVNWALSDGGLRKGQVQQAQSRLDQASLEKDELILEVEGEVREAYYNFLEAKSILETSQLVIQQAEEALRLARNRYQAGRGTQLDVLESQLQLTRAKLERSTALHDMNLASIEIKRAVGVDL